MLNLNGFDGRSATAIAARRGRRSVLALFQRRGAAPLVGVDALIAACALHERGTIQVLMAEHSNLRAQLIKQGGTLLAEFAGNGNAEGVRHLLDCGIGPSALYREGDGYLGVATDSTALHVAAWRVWPEVVKELIARGTPIDALDGRGRTALQLAITACVDSFWTERRSPEVVAASLEAGDPDIGGGCLIDFVPHTSERAVAILQTPDAALSVSLSLRNATRSVGLMIPPLAAALKRVP